MQQRNTFKGRSGVTRLKNAVTYSIQGYKFAWQDEEAFRQIILVSFVGIPCALFFGKGFTQKILLMLPCFLCIIVELLNTAIENVVDRISLEHNDLAKKAKDMGSAAQLSAQIFLASVWVLFIFC